MSSRIDVRFGKAFLDVALARLSPVRDVRAALREEPRAARVVAEVGMDQHGVVLERFAEVENGRQFLVRHLHQLGRALGGLRVARDDRRDLLADEPHAVRRRR